MAWVEIANLRSQRSRTYQDNATLRRCLSATLATLHYESSIDSGIYDAEVDLELVRVDVPAFDGWRVTAAGWHYALGQDIANHGDQDGWVGFGGHQGAHWFKFRLSRVGYLHWPTRAWDDIGGTPTYNRANLTQHTRALAIGPNDDMINVESVATWEYLWTTPSGGSLDVSWKMRGDQLKEKVTINQAARTWIAANRPPATPLNETWFGFIFRLDWSDVPKIVRDGIQQDPDSDFSDDGEDIHLNDELDRLLAFLPISHLIVQDGDDEISREQLRKRLWLDDDGNHYLLIGIRCDILAGLPVGDLVFDPTLDEQVSASADDAMEEPDGDVTADTSYCRYDSVNSEWGFFRVALADIASGDTIDVAYAEYFCDVGWADDADDIEIYCEDVDSSAQAVNGTGTYSLSNRTRTTASVTWSETGLMPSGEGFVDTPSLVSPVQEVINRGGWSAGNYIGVLARADGSDFRTSQYDLDAAEAPTLYIEYTVAGGNAMPMAMDTYRRRRVA